MYSRYRLILTRCIYLTSKDRWNMTGSKVSELAGLSTYASKV